ncbi:MAG: hypothetical protein K2Q34_05880 [Alphaproteobacteria bacterium]|nr:hypothetical protein [Alphaproteobacteria bacterium]
MINKNIPDRELEKLIQAAEHDMQVRASLIENGELQKFGYHPKMKAVHEENLVLLEDFISKYGWPIPSLHGKKAFESAWFICIHAIEHPKQMIQGRDSIKELLDKGEAVGHEYACIYDRIALYTDGRQKYGTQFWPSRKGWHLKGLEDAEKADEYRAQIGMESLSQRWREMESYTDENGVIEDEEARDLEFEKWLEQAGWRKALNQN